MNADVHTLSGAYALDALPPDESRAFTDHLAQCPTCRQEVAELRTTAAQLGLAVTEQPPASLRERVLDTVSQTRQVPPDSARTGDHYRRTTRQRQLAAAAALVLVAGGGGLALGQVLDEPGPTAARPSITAVVNAPDARGDTTRLRGGGTMTVISSPRLGRAVVISDNLPPLQAEKIYQLWLVNPDGRVRSADVFIDNAQTAATGAKLVGGVRPGDQIAITREPAGGSDQPTMAPLAVIRAA